MNRCDFVLLFDVKDANPNGDPDAGNLPRIDPETGNGLVTDVCLKRKVRNYVALKGGEKNRIYFTEGAVLNNIHLEGWEHVGLKEEKDKKKMPKDYEKARGITRFMCENFFDIRTFGAVMSTEINAGQVRGPVQISFARSIDPILSSEHAITRSSVTNEKDTEKERTIGRKFTVPYGLYRASGVVNPFLADGDRGTGFSEKDCGLLWEALEHMFDIDQSAARPAGSMATQKLIIFKHDSSLGNAPAHKLFSRVKAELKDKTKPPRDFSDYTITIDRSGLPTGVEIIEK